MSKFFRKDDLVTKAELGEKLWELERYVSKYLRTFGLKDGILEDAVQETLMNGWMHIEQLRDVSRMKWWVRSIAKNVGLKYAKKINAQNVIVIGDNEVSADSYTVKDMLKGLETAVRKEDIGQFFQKI